MGYELLTDLPKKNSANVLTVKHNVYDIVHDVKEGRDVSNQRADCRSKEMEPAVLSTTLHTDVSVQPTASNGVYQIPKKGFESEENKRLVHLKAQDGDVMAPLYGDYQIVTGCEDRVLHKRTQKTYCQDGKITPFELLDSAASDKLISGRAAQKIYKELENPQETVRLIYHQKPHEN